MPRLPDLDSLGARPVPASRSRVVSTPGVGMVGDAISGIGEQLYRGGQQMFEKQDKLAFAAARTTILKADVTARAELEKDQDWTTYEARYTDAMKLARDNARKMIRSNSERAMFDAESDLDFERGRADLLKVADAKRVVSERAIFETSLDELRDTAMAATDEPTRAAAIQTASDMFDAGVSKGLIDADSAGKARRGWVSDYLSEQISTELLKENAAGAVKIYEANADKLDWQSRLNLQTDIKRAVDGQVASSDFTRATVLPSVGAKAAEGGSGDPVKDGAAVVKALYPQARQTSNYRAADHPLSKANPRSWHTKTHAAVDVAPIGGMTFEDYVKGYEEAGYTILEAKNEVGSGRSAHATGDHWHIVLGEGGGGVRSEARRWDKESVYTNIDTLADKEGWTLERRERAREFADRQISRDEQLLGRKEAEADRQASEIILGKNDSFTNINAIPRSIWNGMSTAARGQAMEIAERNSKPKEVKANGVDAITLEVLAIAQPETFMNTDLSKYVGKITPGELSGLVTKQVTLKTNGGPPQVSIRGNITGEIGRRTSMDEALKKALDSKKEPGNYLRLYQSMESYIRNATDNKRNPTDQELDAAFAFASRRVFLEGDDDALPAYSVDPNDVERSAIPKASYDTIVTRFQARYGRAPSGGEVAKIYRDNAGRF